MNWFQPALERLRALPQDADHRLRAFLSPKHPVYIARAPGRLDVMGGIADYSGARVLELPLSCATVALVQLQAERHCDIATWRGDRWDLFSIDLPLAEPAELAAWFHAHETERWAGYVVGVVQAMLARTAAGGGLRIVVDSSVPEGRGVASSAALEVAVAMAVAAAYELDITATDLAALCQRVENEIVGAPCGIMDQLTSVCGKANRLLQLHCQPGTVEGYIEIPSKYRFYGIDSGISHAVSGADYGTVRTAAFMGLRIIRVETGWRGRFLANLTPSQLAEVSGALPEEMSGIEFLARYGGISDTATNVIPERSYPVRSATHHPVGEQERVDRFASLLEVLPEQSNVAAEIGSLMYGSHQSYSACGLGSAGTDRLVELVRAAGPAQGLFGAKITGGGSGGTVAIFATLEAEDCVREIASHYGAETEDGRAAYVFAESGPGAVELGVITEPGLP
jgi:galactokinase